MSSDHPDAGSPADRAKRPPPTIDLDPSDVTENDAGSQTQDTARDSANDRSRPWFDSVRRSPFEHASGALTPALSGATAAALILTGAWLLGLSGDDRTASAPAVTAVPADTSAADALASRLAKVEADVAARAIAPSQPAPDPAILTRVDQIETSLKSVNDALANLRGELERALAAAKDTAARDGSAAASPDLAAIDQRFARIEAAQRSVAPLDDRPLRRAVAANALDLAVRQGEPFTAALAAAKAVAPDAALQPLEVFAGSGLPSDAALSRELIVLLPQLAPQAAKQPAAAATTGTGVFDRLQESAARLVRVERVDAASGSQPPPATATIATAARANDVAGARRAVMDLPPPQRAPAQGWLDRVSARDAAREAARQFASGALAALGKPAQ